MKPNVLALLPLMFCLSNCGEKRIVKPLPIPAERTACVPAGPRPSIPPEFTIDWSRVQTVPQAKEEHEKFVGIVRTREKIVAGYIILVEGKLFACANNMLWIREFQDGLE